MMSPSHSALHKRSVPQLLRPYKCSLCYKTFQKQNHLTRHIKIHSDERRHKCPYCGKAFLRSDNLKKHIRIHTGEKFPCPYCNKGFTDSSNLTKHIRTHTGEGRHRCKFCLKHFAALSALQKHVQEHEEEMLLATDTPLVKTERTDASDYLSYLEQNGHLNEKESQRPVYPSLSERNQNSFSEEPYSDTTNSFNSNLSLVKTERNDDSDYLSFIEQNQNHLNEKELFHGSARPTSPLLPKRNQNFSSDEPYSDKRNSFVPNLLPQMMHQGPVIPAVSRKVEKAVNPFKSYLPSMFDDNPFPHKQFEVFPRKSSPHSTTDKCPTPFALKDQRLASPVKMSTSDLLQKLSRPVNTNQNLPLWQCVLCLEEFSSCFPLLTHLKRHVNNGVQIPDPWDHDNTAPPTEASSVEQLNCSYCQKVFTRQSELLAHMDLTLCKNCGAIFSCSTLLENHNDTCKINWVDREASNKSKDNYNNAIGSKSSANAVSSEIPVDNYQETDGENHTLDTKVFPLLTAVKQEIIFSDTENAVPDHHLSPLAAVDSDLSLNRPLSPTLLSQTSKQIKDDLIDPTLMLTNPNMLSHQQNTHSNCNQEISTEIIHDYIEKPQAFHSGVTVSLDILPKPEPLEEPISVNPQKPLTLLDSQQQNFSQDVLDSTKDVCFNVSVYDAYKCAKAALNDPDVFQHQSLHSSSESNVQSFWCQNCGKNFQSVFEFREHFKLIQKFINKFSPENSNKLEALKKCLNIHLLHSVSGNLESNLVRGDAQLELTGSENTQSKRVQPERQHFQLPNQPVQPPNQPVQTPSVSLNANNNSLLLTCNVCHKSFTRTTQLNRHRKIHLGIKNHKCSFCSKTFLRSDNLRKHLRIHLGIKQYACTICKRRFTDSSNLVKHQRIHNSDRQGFFCNLCCRSFASYTAFCKHIETHKLTLIEGQSTADGYSTDKDVGTASPTLIERQSITDEHFPDNDVVSASAKTPQKTSRVGAGVHTKNNLQIKILDANVCEKTTFESQSSDTNQLKALKVKLARKLNSSMNKNGNLCDASFDSRDFSSLLKHSTEPEICSSNSFDQNQISSRSSKLSQNAKYESFCPSPEEFSVYLEPQDVPTQSLEGDQLKTKRLGSRSSCNGSDQTEEPKLEKNEEWNHDILQIVPLPKEPSASLDSESSSVNNIFVSLTEQIKDNLTLDMVVDDKKTYCSPMQSQLESGTLEPEEVSCASEINTINIKSDQNSHTSTTNFSSSFASCDSAKTEPVSENSASDLTASNACFTERATEDKLEMSAYYSTQSSPNNFVKPIAQGSQLEVAGGQLDKKLPQYSGIHGTFENSPNSADNNSMLGNLATYLYQLRDCSLLTKSG